MYVIYRSFVTTVICTYLLYNRDKLFSAKQIFQFVKGTVDICVVKNTVDRFITVCTQAGTLVDLFFRS